MIPRISDFVRAGSSVWDLETCGFYGAKSWMRNGNTRMVALAHVRYENLMDFGMETGRALPWSEWSKKGICIGGGSTLCNRISISAAIGCRAWLLSTGLAVIVVWMGCHLHTRLRYIKNLLKCLLLKSCGAGGNEYQKLRLDSRAWLWLCEWPNTMMLTSLPALSGESCDNANVYSCGGEVWKVFPAWRQKCPGMLPAPSTRDRPGRFPSYPLDALLVEAKRDVSSLFRNHRSESSFQIRQGWLIFLFLCTLPVYIERERQNSQLPFRASQQAQEQLYKR